MTKTNEEWRSEKFSVDESPTRRKDKGKHGFSAHYLAMQIDQRLFKIVIIMFVISACVTELQGLDVDAIKRIAHESAALELDGFARGHGDALHGLGILCHARRPHADFKHAEIAELQTVAGAQVADHV